MSLALAVTVAALAGSGVAELRSARADMRRMQAEYGLGGAHVMADQTVIADGQGRRMRWRFDIAAGQVEALAEPEAGKLDYETAASLDDAAFGRLGVRDAAALRAKLVTLAKTHSGTLASLVGSDAAPGWRRCAPSVVSRVGRADKPSLSAAVAPSPRPGSSRAGEVWRVRLSLGGWTEDRIVRFTGDLNHPAAIIDRSLYRAEGEDRCETLVN
ncbi:MAG: hypothetical protein JSR45_12520 [Proteobacteria bacterium]|nr:hypothetical protein [Pseudomonadota bacterium]